VFDNWPLQEGKNEPHIRDSDPFHFVQPAPTFYVETLLNQGQYSSTYCWPSVLSHKYILTCGKGLRGKVEERGGVDAVASSTTNDKEIVRNPFSPGGLGPDGPDLCVVPPRRYYGIASSSRLDLKAVALPTSVNVFMTQDTS
jgi:hypothetical protein